VLTILISAIINWRGKGGNITSARWQVTLCDPIWHVSSRSVLLRYVTIYTQFYVPPTFNPEMERARYAFTLQPQNFTPHFGGNIFTNHPTKGRKLSHWWLLLMHFLILGNLPQIFTGNKNHNFRQNFRQGS